MPHVSISKLLAELEPELPPASSSQSSVKTAADLFMEEVEEETLYLKAYQDLYSGSDAYCSPEHDPSNAAALLADFGIRVPAKLPLKADPFISITYPEKRKFLEQVAKWMRQLDKTGKTGRRSLKGYYTDYYHLFDVISDTAQEGLLARYILIKSQLL